MKTYQKNELIVMLTYNDVTVGNAERIFDTCKDSKARCWGFKEEGIPFERMKQLQEEMHRHGKTTFLEVVDYTEEGGLGGAKTAAACGFDILMGTKFFDSICKFCKAHKLKYMPFVGDIVGRPSILTGEIDAIIAEANADIAKGADGIDLLGYRYEGNPLELNKRLVKEVQAPVCIAGSIDSTKRLDEVKTVSPWAFTIGSAFFDNKFGNDINRQIETVIDYMQS